MKKIVVIPLGRIEDYLDSKYTYEYLENYFNPNGCFDEVYCLSNSGVTMKVGKVQYINAHPDKFNEIISEIHPDIVRAYAGCEPCDWAVANRVKGIPIVVSVHDPNTDLMHQSLKYADYIICMSQVVKEAVIKHVIDVDKRKIYVMPNRVDTNIFYKRDDKESFKDLNRVYGDGIHILHVGRKVMQKNLETLIQALQYLPVEYKAVFIGHGEVAPYKKLAHACQVEERCFFVDSVNREKLPIYYSWCDCMCTPSRYEGFGIVFIEAAACECSIVTSNIPPMNEYLTDKKDCILVDEYESPEILAKAIAYACGKDEKIYKMKRNAREVGLKFDKKFVDRQEIELYNIFIKNGSDDTHFDKLEKEREKLKLPVVAFGAGKMGKRLLDYLGNKNIMFFVDNDRNKIGQQIGGVEIISYADFKKIKDKYIVVVTPENRKEIVQKLMFDGIEYMEDAWYRLLLEQVK